MQNFGNQNQGQFSGQGHQNNGSQQGYSNNGQSGGGYTGPDPDLYVRTKTMTRKDSGEAFPSIYAFESLDESRNTLYKFRLTSAFRELLANHGIDLSQYNDLVLMRAYKEVVSKKPTSGGQQSTAQVQPQGNYQNAPMGNFGGNQGYAQTNAQGNVQQGNWGNGQGGISNFGGPAQGFSQTPNLDGIPF